MKKARIFYIIVIALLTATVVVSALVLADILSNRTEETKNEANEEYEFYLRGYLTDGYYEKEAHDIRSNLDRIELNERYEAIWSEHIDFCYKQLTDYYKENNNTAMFDKTVASQEDWKKYFEYQKNFYSEYLNDRYEGGTAEAQFQSEYQMNLCRERAIELYKICVELGIDVGSL